MAETLATRSAIARSTLVWCGVQSPTPTEVELASLAADAAIDTIRFYRGLDRAAEKWVAETDYALYDVREPTLANNHLYRCTTAGTSGTTEPVWPDSGTVTDGTVVWTEYTRPFEREYTSLAVEMAVYLYQKRGADGASSYGENGVQRAYEKGSFPPSMLARITLPATTG